MKNNIIIGVAVLVGVGLAGLSQAVVTSPGIKGSKHDLSSTLGTDGEICIVCHTPHNADTTIVNAPLWNHLPSAEGTTYTMYAGTGTYDAKLAVGAATAPTGISKLCLSCHDGTTAPDAFTGHAGSATMIGGVGNLGTDLSKSHPISFKYNTDLVAADALTSGVTGLNDPTETPIKAWLGSAGEFECSSCHDVHNKIGLNAMLNKDNAGSSLCITCHAK